MHTPVLLNEVIDGLQLSKGMTVIDGTVGGGGHTKAVLECIGPSGKLLGLDADATTLQEVRRELTNHQNVRLIHAWFDELTDVAESSRIIEADAILLDLGFSSLQLDDATRGFSFQADGPLDMRLNSGTPLTAWEIVNKKSERELADILLRYGELYDARRLAKAIHEARIKQAIDSTTDLVRAIGIKNPGVKAKIFQALRIAVNDELGRLLRVIPQAVALLAPGGRIAIISFHSLEDRIVKNSFRSNHLLTVITKKPIIPSQQEVATNPRSRSAKLRIAEKI